MQAEGIPLSSSTPVHRLGDPHGLLDEKRRLDPQCRDVWSNFSLALCVLSVVRVWPFCDIDHHALLWSRIAQGMASRDHLGKLFYFFSWRCWRTPTLP